MQLKLWEKVYVNETISDAVWKLLISLNSVATANSGLKHGTCAATGIFLNSKTLQYEGNEMRIDAFVKEMKEKSQIKDLKLEPRTYSRNRCTIPTS